MKNTLCAGVNAKQNDEPSEGRSQLDKIPFKFMDMHSDIQMLFEEYMEEKNILPKSGFNVVSFNAHVDEIVPEDVQIRLLVSPPKDEKHLFDDFGVQSWIKMLAEKGHIKSVIWIKPPWTKGVLDISRNLQIVNAESNNTTHEVTLDIKTLGRSVVENLPENYEQFQSLFSKHLSNEDPFILDFELSFFSCDNPFTDEYEKSPTYYSLFKELFKLKEPASMDPEDIKAARNEREEKLKELEEIFNYLDSHRSLPDNKVTSIENYQKVSEIKEELLKYYKDEEIKWKNIYAAGLVCNDHQLPVHYTERADIEKLVNECVSKVVDFLPKPPTLIVVAIMYEYLRFTREKDLDFIIDLIKELFKNKYADLDTPEFIFY